MNRGVTVPSALIVLALITLVSSPAGGVFTISFGPVTNYTVGAFPRSVALGDVNGDGALDIAAANEGSNTVSMLLGNGTGAFAAATHYGVGSQPYFVTLKDISGDGKLDIAVTNRNGSTVSILLGSGTGTFASASVYSAGATPQSVAIGDLNADGKPDLAITNFSTQMVSIKLGSGDGAFVSPTGGGAYPTGANPVSVAIGDVNGHGRLDLATANSGANTVSIRLGNGNATFQAAVDVAVGGTPQSVAIDDLDDDGKLDLAVFNPTSNAVAILLGSGDATFAPPVNYAAGGPPFILAVGGTVAIKDLNGDGKPDLGLAPANSELVSILMGNGDGSFAAAVKYDIAYNGSVPSIAIGDLNGDGKGDLAVANYYGAAVSILLNTSPAWTSPFTDDPLSATTAVRAIHVTELQNAINTMRARHSMTAYSFADAPLTVGSPIRAVHIAELRTALHPVYDVIEQARPAYVDSTISAGVTVIRRLHIRQIRDAARRAAEWSVLTVSRAGTGSGTVTSYYQPGINCGIACAKAYLPGSYIQLSAAPAGGSSFAGWSGACTGTGSCQPPMTADSLATATFNVLRYTLTVTKSGAGAGSVTSSPAGIDCGSVCLQTYNSGTSVSLTATAAAGSTFANWTGACSGSGTCTVPMNADVAVGARFNQSFTLTVTKAGTGTGTVASSPAGISCGADCTEPYNAGTSVTLTASAASGSYFANWTGACSGSGGCTVPMNAAATVGATFNIALPHTMTVTKNGTGTGTITSSPAGISCGADCSEIYYTGTSVTLTASAAAGSYFANWGGACSGAGTCTQTMTSDRAVTATFNTFSIDIDIARGTVRMPNKYRQGDWSVGGAPQTNFVAVPPGWNVDGGSATNFVAVPPGWSVQGASQTQFIAVPPGWSLGGGSATNFVAVPPGWSVGGGSATNFVTLPPGWTTGGEPQTHFLALPPGWTVGGGSATNFVAVPPVAGWSVGGAAQTNYVALGPGWTAGGGSATNFVSLPPGWSVGGAPQTNFVAYPSATLTTLELAFNDPGWLAWGQVLKTTGAMSDSDLADVFMYILSGGGWRYQHGLVYHQGLASSGWWR